MKKLILIGSLVLSCCVLIGAAIHTMSVFPPAEAKKPCVGFTVIEAGKGVNCHGDTIRLRKINGFYTAINNINK